MRKKDWRLRLPFFYGWVVVGAAFASLGLALTVWYSFSVFFVALVAEFGWGRGPAAGVFSLFVVTHGLGGMLSGALSDRFGPGRVASVGAVVTGLALLACSQISELWQFYLFYGVVAALGVTTCGWVPSVTMLSRWFSTRLGAAMGIASAGIGVGILVMVPLTQLIITGMGWRSAYQVLAVIVVAGVLPISLLVMRGRPEGLGLPKDGRRSLSQGGAGSAPPTRKRELQVVDREWASREWTVATAMRTRRYWLLVLMSGLSSIATQTIFVHQVAFLTDGGYDKMLAASIVGLVGLLSVGTKIGGGWMADRLGRDVTWTIGLTFMIGSILVLLSTRLVALLPVVYLYAVVFAVGYGASAPLSPVIAADVFAGRRFGSIYGTMGVANGCASALGAWFAGYIFDTTGSYFIAFICAVFTTLASIIGIWVAAPRKVRRVTGAGG